MRLVSSVSALLFWAVCDLTGAAPHAAHSTSAMKDSREVCNSLTGPFCLHLGADASYASYMTPIDPSDPANAEITTRKRLLDDILTDQKKCFFQHFTRSWMDAGGEANDLMSQRVQTIDQCEQLCCAHPKCKSYTFWMGHTCFLRAKRNVPRGDGDSFSANKLQG